MDNNIRERNIKKFEELMDKVNREGKEELLEYIRTKTDFYTAPASTNFHLSCEGGLLQHSLNVYDCLMAKKSNPVWAAVMADISEESLIIMSVLHDFCKTNFYTKGYRNQKTYDPDKVRKAERWQIKYDELGDFIWETVPKYEVRDTIPLGHGEKSVILIQTFMKLKATELFAIRWHMGFSESKESFVTLGQAMEKYPIILCLHEADMEASKLLEDAAGNRET